MAIAADSAAVGTMLAEIERTERVRVCLAVESGSRAWGFPSRDSDFDVRFVYVHELDWYLTIDGERDVIERPLTGMVDLSGWDIRKALQLFRKSNPPLLEWLQCPIVYKEHTTFASTLRAMLPRFYSPRASFHHYLHMARGNFREYLQGETVWRKKYLYVLRPLLATRWIGAGRGPVPIEFMRLVDATVAPGLLRTAIEDLVRAKAAGDELDHGPRVGVISEFIETELARPESLEGKLREKELAKAELDRLFRSTLREAWADMPA
jgi:predicted nucleotidyltransferase